MTRICFLNPFCGDRADSLIEETVSPYLRNGTTVDVWHHKTGPDFPDYYVSKHLTEVEIMRSAVAAERAGYDAFVIGCSYDPGLTQCRELVNIPVVGPLESSTALARSFGHRYSVLTDHHKAVPELEDRLRVYGTSANCRSVRAIDWFGSDMLLDLDAVADDARAKADEVAERDGAEAIIWGCTLIAAAYERAVLQGRPETSQVAIINPNVVAVKVAEMFADMQAVGQYRMSRKSYYQPQSHHDQESADQIAALLGVDPVI